MAHKVPANWDNCATCAYWLADREPDYFCQWVTVDSASTKGKCLCRRSGWYRTDKPATQSCRSYKKWEPLDQ